MSEVIFSTDKLSGLQTKNKILSIQLGLNGLSFSITTSSECYLIKECPFDTKLSAADNFRAVVADEPLLCQTYKRVNLFLDTPQALLVPEELFDYSARRLFLENSGIEIAESQTVLRSQSMLGIVAVIAFDNDLMAAINQQFESVAIYHNILVNLYRGFGKEAKNGDSIFLNLGQQNVSISVIVDKRLVYVEILPMQNNAEVLYFVKQIMSQYCGKELAVYCWGKDSLVVTEFLSNYVEDVKADIIPWLQRPLTDHNNIIL